MWNTEAMWGMYRNDTANLAKELGGTQWGLLPVLLIWPVLMEPGWFNWQQAAMLVFASLMASNDLATRRIPNSLNLITAVTGLLGCLVYGGVETMAWATLSGVMVFAFMCFFFFIGAVGGGDVKALAALACFLSPMTAIYLFVFTTLAGGAFAVSLLIVKRFKEFKVAGLGAVRMGVKNISMPYGLAIWSGVVLLLIGGYA